MCFFILATYGGPSTLPLVLADKCDDSTCSTITSDLDVVKACFNDPTDASSCRGKWIDTWHRKVLKYPTHLFDAFFSLLFKDIISATYGGPSTLYMKIWPNSWWYEPIFNEQSVKVYMFQQHMVDPLLYPWFLLISVMVLHVLQSHQTLMLSKLVSLIQQTLLAAEVTKLNISKFLQITKVLLDYINHNFEGNSFVI